jgi:hypothetical protein
MAARSRRIRRTQRVCQFLIVLSNTDPLVWRRIQVPETYSFWDLHIAIQDAMGWKDSHLHEFTVVDPNTGQVAHIGIPDEEMVDERPLLAGWKVPITQHLALGMVPMRYRYDFGDNWEHIVEFEGVIPADGGAYPRCLAGAGACPPEDVGGPFGYADFLKAIGDPHHAEHGAMLEWVGGRFDPHAFDPQLVRFDNPRERWKIAFEDNDHDL